MLDIAIKQTWDGQPIDPDEYVFMKAGLDQEALTIEVDAPFHHDTAPDVPPGRCDRLWEYEVVELFLVGPEERYLEVELGPHGHYLALCLSGIRNIERDDLPVELAVSRWESRWSGIARVAAEHLPRQVERWNAFAIHGSGASRRYVAAHPVPGAEPDFHRLHRFPRISR